MAKKCVKKVDTLQRSARVLEGELRRCTKSVPGRKLDIGKNLEIKNKLQYFSLFLQMRDSNLMQPYGKKGMKRADWDKLISETTTDFLNLRVELFDRSPLKG